MARDQVNDNILENEEMLVSYLEEGCKPKALWRLGTEHEKFAYDLQNYTLLPYKGKKSIETLLKGMQDSLKWDPIYDKDNIIGLYDLETQAAISIEPGGQFELSGAPLVNVHECLQELREHFSALYQIADPLHIDFLGLGANPLSKREQIPMMPKRRYHLMKDYMPKVGSKGLDMMFRTATTQVNLDYGCEEDMRCKMQVSVKIQPLVTALFALSPFTEGKPNGYLSWRSHIWQHTDPDRTGILPFVFHQNFGFQDYVNWALNIPMYFILRNSIYYDAKGMTFKEFLKGGFKDQCPENYQPTLGDWINHLSTLFPEVRLKQFLEMRGADSGSISSICALTAFFAGILYDQESLEEVSELVKNWAYEDVLLMRENTPKYGLDHKINSRSLWDYAEKILTIAKKGLEKRNFYNDKQENETIYLDFLWDIIKKKQTGAQKLLVAYENEWNKNLLPVFKDYSYKNYFK